MIEGFLHDAEAAIARNAMAKAKTLYQGILRIDDTNLEALTQAAAIALAEDEPQTALSYYSIAVEQHSKVADVHHGLSVAYRDLGLDDKAELALKTALRIEPDHEPALFDQAVLFQKQGKLKKAEQIYLKIAAKDGHRVDAIFNRGVVMFRKGNIKAAERWFRQAAKIDPDAPRPLVNLALIYRYWGYFDAAERCLNHVIDHHPDFVDAQWNLANLELLLGNLKDGFPRAEWRFKREGFNPPIRHLPRWKGENLDGKKLLLLAEQGLGDTAQMIRYAKVFADQGLTVGVEAQPSLSDLLATAPGVQDVLKPGDLVDDYDAWLPVMSIPAMLKTTVESIPGEVPYLSVPSSQPPIELPANSFKVGFVWQGNPKHENDRFRSIPWRFWKPVFATPGVQFVNLQVDAELPPQAPDDFAEPVFDAAPLLTDFSATSRVISDLDLVISVDTAVAHLAGAMGKPVWLLISPANDWRWLTERDDTPWYPTMTIFRAKKLNTWRDLMSEVAARLAERVSLK